MVRTETRRNQNQNENTTPPPSTPLLATQQQPNFVGLPGATPYGAPQYPNTAFPNVLPYTNVPAFPNIGGVPLTPAAIAAFQGLPFGPFTAPAYPPGAPQHPQFPVHQQVAQPGGLGIPAAIQDLGREIVATFELPGIAASDLSVVVGNSSINLQGQRPAANGRVYQGTFPLPAEVLPSQASARLENGLLVVTLPRRTPTEEPRRVEIDQ